MDVQLEFKISLPTAAWDLLPLPGLVSSAAESYELVVQLQLPQFVSKLLRLLSSNVVGATSTSAENNAEQQQVFIEPQLRAEARQLIEKGNFNLCDEGVGGTYFVTTETKKKLAVFKPQDEEPGAPNNPKKLVQKPLLPPGGGAIREVAAYLLDKECAGVPETYMLSNVRHKKFCGDGDKSGSLQRFVPNDGVSSDMGSSIFDVDDVHHIGILDLRLFNLDRNGENILVVKNKGNSNNKGDNNNKNNESKFHLVPIDHSYCLPSIRSLDGAFFEWQFWSQAKKPFSLNTLEYIRSIDIEHDAQVLRALGIPEECIGTMVVSTLLLKRGSAMGMTLSEISSLVSRKKLDTPSYLEKMIAEAEKNAHASGTNFLVEYLRCLEVLEGPNKSRH